MDVSSAHRGLFLWAESAHLQAKAWWEESEWCLTLISTSCADKAVANALPLHAFTVKMAISSMEASVPFAPTTANSAKQSPQPLTTKQTQLLQQIPPKWCVLLVIQAWL
jgi:hypothetical protein